VNHAGQFFSQNDRKFFWEDEIIKLSKKMFSAECFLKKTTNTLVTNDIPKYKKLNVSSNFL